MMNKYIFADCPFNIDFKKGNRNYDDYLAENCDVNNKVITICDYSDIVAFSYGVEHLTEGFNRFFRSRENPTSVMFANDDWSRVSICRGENGEYSEELMITAVYSQLCAYKTLFLHASYIDYEGNGIVFVGPSGIGKTTQAELWQQYQGAQIVNGDKAFIRIVDDIVYAYGSPWHGSSQYSVNMKSQLKGIVVLSQADENRIRKLNEIETMQMFMPHVFMPHWDEISVKQVLETLDLVIKKVPVWFLECRPDQDAVEITKKTVLDNH